MTTEQLNLYYAATVGAAEGVWKYYIRPEVTIERAVAVGVVAVSLLSAKLIQASLELQRNT